MVNYTKDGQAKHKLDRPEIRSYLWEHGLLQAVLKSIAGQRNSYSHHVRGILFGHFIPARNDYRSNLTEAGRILRGAVHGRADREGWSSLMPCLAACSTFRSGKGSANIFASSSSAELTNSMKRKLNGKTVQHILRHPAHEALTRLLIIKAIIQTEDSPTRRSKGSNEDGPPKSTTTKEKVSPFSNNETAVADIITEQGNLLTMPPNLSRGPGYTSGDIKYFKHLVSVINDKERPEMRAQQPIPNSYFFNFPEDSTGTSRKRSHDEVGSHQGEPSQLLMPIISLDEVDMSLCSPQSSQITNLSTAV